MSTPVRRNGFPNCGYMERFGEADILQATAIVLSFDTVGRPNYAGTSDIDWNSQRQKSKY